MIKREASYALLGSIVYATSQWLLITVLIKIGGVAEGGFYALCMAVLSPIISLSNLNMRSAQVMDSTERWSFGEYFGVRLTLSSIGFAACLVIGWFAINDGWERFAAFAMLGLYRLFAEGLSDVVQGHFQRVTQYRLIATAYLLKSTLGIILFWLALRFAHSEWLGFLALACTSLSVLWGFELRKLRAYVSIKPVFDRQLGDLVYYTAPLGFAMVVGSVQINLPRYFLEHFAGTRELGIFAAMSYMIVAGSLIGTAVGNAVAPTMGRFWDNKDYDRFMASLKRLLGFDLLLGALAMAAAALVGRQVLLLAYNKEVADRASVLPLFGVVLMFAFADSHLGMAVTAMKRNRAVFSVNVISLVVLLPVMWIIVRQLHLVGAIVAATLSYAFTATYYAYLIVSQVRALRADAIRNNVVAL